MSLVEEYLRIYKEYQAEYGDRTALFMQVGSFYNMYAINQEGDYSVELMTDIASCLGLRITFMVRDDYANRGTLKNPYLIGYPCSVWERSEFLLLNNNYTVVIYDQTKLDKTKRQRAKLLSPLTVGETIQKENINSTNQIMTIYIEVIKGLKKMDKIELLAGVSNIDVITGKNEVREIYNRKEDSKYVLNELYRILSSNKPKEVQFYINLAGSQVDPVELEKYIVDNLELASYPLMSISFNINKEYFLSNYQEQFLNLTFKRNAGEVNSQQIKIFLNKGIVDIFIELGLERLKYGTISYILLIQYCHSHSETLFNKIKKPIVNQEEGDQRLILEHNSIIQLNLVQSNVSKVNYRINRGKNYDTLLSVIGKCSTSMGRRAIREKVLHPLINIKTIREKHNIIEYLRDQKDYRDLVLNKLKELYDIERLNFKLHRGSMSPKEFYNLYTSYHIVIELINDTVPHVYDQSTNSFKPLYYIFPDRNSLLGITDLIREVHEFFDLKILEECAITDGVFNCKNSPIRQGKYPAIDNYQNIIKMCTDRLTPICNTITEIVSGGKKGVKAGSFAKKKKKAQIADDEEEDEEIINMKDLGIYLTKTQVDKLKRNLDRLPVNVCGELRFEAKNKKYKVRSDIIDYLCDQILTNRNNLSSEIYPVYKNYLDYINDKYDMSTIIQFVIDLDLGITNALNSIKFNYYKPTMVEPVDGKSMLKAKDLRHPLIERIITGEYISNDINLNDTETCGVLLYGCNSIGKSTFTNSVAYAFIMAQAEMWTAGIVELSPVHKIITRLSGEDDKLKGHSSFIVEMLELRSVHRNADSKTLVIGDELCRGTESLSAAAITIGTLEELIKRKCAFVFSTHLHDIPHKDRIIKLLQEKKLNILHLDTTYNDEINELIYNRKLKVGSGESNYGIEVAKSLDMDPLFIKNISEIRKELLNEPIELLSTTKAKYNSGYYKKPCVVCKSYDMTKNETHHIKEQHTADKNGFIGNMSKDVIDNFLSVCKNCHLNIHKGVVTLETVTTPSGIYITFKENKK